MNEDLIKRSDAIRAVSKVDDYGDGIGFEVRSHCLVELELVPSADRPQGEWIEVDDVLISCRCSVCGWEAHLYEDDVYGMPYCPNCGARMKGADDDD